MRLFRRRPIYGPPLPDIECGHRGWRSWMYCDLPFGHDGMHGTIIGTSVKTGAFVESSSVTRELWR